MYDDPMERRGAAILKSRGKLCQGTPEKLQASDIQLPEGEYIEISGRTYTMELFLLPGKAMADVFDNHYGNMLCRRAACFSGFGELLKRVKIWTDEAERIAAPVVKNS